MYDNILKRMSYYVSDSQYNWQKSTHFDSESELYWCMTADEFSSESMWYDFVQTEHCFWAKQEWSLFKKSEHTKQAAVDQLREQNWQQCSQKWEWQCKHCTRWELYKLSALRHMFVQHLHDDDCCCCCCCWACHTRVSAEMCQLREISHTRDKGEEVKEERKRDLS